MLDLGGVESKDVSGMQYYETLINGSRALDRTGTPW